MDQKYLMGVAEIDAQHREISVLINSLQEVIADRKKRQLVHPILKRLFHSLTTHFLYEESLMKMVSYPDQVHHEKFHKGILKIFDDYFHHAPDPCDYEYLGKMINEKVLSHVMEHDLKLSGMLKDYFKRFAAE